MEEKKDKSEEKEKTLGGVEKMVSAMQPSFKLLFFPCNGGQCGHGCFIQHPREYWI